MTTILRQGDCRSVLPTLDAGIIHACVTSPPYYGLRDYGHEDQIGLEATPARYITALVGVFREVRRVLREDGTLWLNIGDSYANDTKWGGSTGGKHTRGTHGSTGIGRQKQATGLPGKCLMGIPWRLAIALVDDGWVLRSDIIWSKPNPLPESVKDRPTKAHEHVFLLAKSDRYFYDAAAIAEPVVRGAAGSTFTDGKTGASGLGRVSTKERVDGETRNRRDVWTIASQPYDGAHFAVMPPKLASLCILAGSPLGGHVLDPFGGSGTVGEVATALGRHATICELNPDYVALAKQRTSQMGLLERAV